jgi:hypothetical protein
MRHVSLGTGMTGLRLRTAQFGCVVLVLPQNHEFKFENGEDDSPG